MKDEAIRRQVHASVDAYASAIPDDPFLAQRILSLDKEEPMMKKKLSFGAVLLIALLLATVTAVAVGLNAYDIWQQSFEKMNTTGELRMLTDPTEEDMPVEEALAIARAAIQEKYAVPDAELDAMGVYPTFIGREWEWGDGTEPDEWEIFYSSVTGDNIDYDYREIGVDGEYRVHINAETKEVTYCHWYTENFWARAQRIWDAGKHDLVYSYYTNPTFYTLPLEEQAHFEHLFQEEGYELRDASQRYITILKGDRLSILFRKPGEYEIAPDDPQAVAAWQIVEEQYGLSRELLEKYCFQAGRMALNTGTDDVFIAYNYENEFARQETGEMDPAVDELTSNTTRLGVFMVSFYPGTTDVAVMTYMKNSAWNREEPIAEGLLLERNDWDAEDLLAFDAVVERYSDAIARLDAADATQDERAMVRRAVHMEMGDDLEWYPSVIEGYDPYQWFSDDTAPKTSAIRIAEEQAQAEKERVRAEVVAQYGTDHRQWPLSAQAQLWDNLSDRKNGELTREAAIEKARNALIAQEGEDALGANWLTGAELMRYTVEQGEVSMWQISFYAPDDSAGWWVQFYDTGAEWYDTDIIITNFMDGLG